MSKTLKMIIIMFVALDLALGLLLFLKYRKNPEAANEQADSVTENTAEITAEQPSEATAHETVQVRTETAFRDNDTIFQYDLTEIRYLYVTVVEGTEAEGTNHTFEQVNAYRNTETEKTADRFLANAIVKAGDAQGPAEGMLGYGKSSANATINVRGKSSTGFSQKSYKLELFKNAGLWYGQRTIALNKHPADCTRFRNALYFKLMREVPSLISLRTGFVHLFICDQTASGDGSGEYVDYGLFTAVEQPNNRFLKNHGLSTGGSLYKAYLFEFYKDEEKLRLSTDPEYDEDLFCTVLEPKADTYDHSGLLEMVDAVNNYTVPIRETIEKYFDLDNLLDYMAFNILMMNPDSAAQNYYLYSPVNENRWYLICWDGDAMLLDFEDKLTENAYRESEWSEGISMYSGNLLFKRMICSTELREQLTERVENYHALFTAEKMEAEITPLYQAVLPLTNAEPDVSRLEKTREQIDLIVEEMPLEVEKGYQNYLDSLLRPLPFFLGNVEHKDGKLKFSWDEAYDFGGELVSYRLQVSKDPTFTEKSLVCEEELYALEAEIPALPAGTYYYRVTAKNASGYTRLPFDQIVQQENYEGMRGFRLEEDGTVVMLDSE